MLNIRPSRHFSTLPDAVQSLSADVLSNSARRSRFHPFLLLPASLLVSPPAGITSTMVRTRCSLGLVTIACVHPFLPLPVTLPAAPTRISCCPSLPAAPALLPASTPQPGTRCLCITSHGLSLYGVLDRLRLPAMTSSQEGAEEPKRTTTKANERMLERPKERHEEAAWKKKAWCGCWCGC